MTTEQIKTELNDIIGDQLNKYLESGVIKLYRQYKDAKIYLPDFNHRALFVNNDWIIPLAYLRQGTPPEAPRGDGKIHFGFKAGYSRARIAKEFQTHDKNNVMHFLEDGCILDGVDAAQPGGLDSDFEKCYRNIPATALRTETIDNILRGYSELFDGLVHDDKGGVHNWL